MAFRRHLITAVLAAVAVLVTATVLAAGDEPRPADDAGQRHPTPGSTSSAPTPGDASRPEAPPPTSTDRATGPADPSAAGTAPTDHGAPSALEVPDPSDSATQERPGLGAEGRRQQAAADELQRDYPTFLVRRHALSAWHPRRNVPVPRRAEVESSSIATEGGVTQVGLVSQLGGSVEGALTFYRIRLARVGFSELASPPVATGATASFRRAQDTVVVAVQPAEGATVVSIHASLRTGG